MRVMKKVWPLAYISYILHGLHKKGDCMAGSRHADCPVGCNGKRRYTKETARRIARKLQSRDGDRMTYYRCSYGGYHVGHCDPEQAALRRRINGDFRKGSGNGIVMTGQPIPSNRGRNRFKNGKRNRSRNTYAESGRQHDEDAFDLCDLAGGTEG